MCGRVVTSCTSRTRASRSHCLTICWIVRSSPRVTIVTRDQRGSRLSPTEIVSMLNPRALNSPTIRDNSPGSSATIIDNVCLMLNLVCDHLTRIGPSRHHRKHILFLCHHNIDHRHSLILQRLFHHLPQLRGPLNSKPLRPVSLSQLHKIRCH